MYNTLENVHLLDMFQIPWAVSGGVERHPRHPPAYGPDLPHQWSGLLFCDGIMIKKGMPTIFFVYFFLWVIHVAGCLLGLTDA